MTKLSETPPEEALSAGGSTAVLARIVSSKFHDEMTVFCNAEMKRPDFNEAHLLAGLLRHFLYSHASLAAQFLKPSGDSVTRDAIIIAVNAIYCDHAAAVREQLTQGRMEATP